MPDIVPPNTWKSPAQLLGLAHHRRRARLALYSWFLPFAVFFLSLGRDWIVEISLVIPAGLFVYFGSKAGKLVCPRCGELFFQAPSGYWNIAARKCMSCGLSVHTREEDLPGQGDKPPEPPDARA